MMTKIHSYGEGDTSYQAAGQLAGLTQLVNDFYDYMETLPVAKVIRDMHPADMRETRIKLIYFLSGWLGGPKLYQQHYGPIRLPQFHQSLPIAEAERDAWMLCMEKAVAQQPFSDAFKHYLLKQLWVPAQRINTACSGYQSWL